MQLTAYNTSAPRLSESTSAKSATSSPGGDTMTSMPTRVRLSTVSVEMVFARLSRPIAGGEEAQT